MKILLNIPNYEFNNDIADKFQDYFNRVKKDIADGTLCGNYELETTEMFLASFKRLQVLPDNVTNGDVIKVITGEDFSRGASIYNHDLMICEGEYYLAFNVDWWNAPYKEVNDGSI